MSQEGIARCVPALPSCCARVKERCLSSPGAAQHQKECEASEQLAKAARQGNLARS